MSMKFSKEVGYEKGSWKGGTLGHSIEISPGESALNAFIRYGTSIDQYKNYGMKPRGFSNVEIISTC